MIKFRLEISTTHEVIGYEYLVNGHWYNNVYDYGERPGAFDQMELGDGFLGVVERKRFVTTDFDGREIYEGDSIKWRTIGAANFRSGRAIFSEDKGGFLFVGDGFNHPFPDKYWLASLSIIDAKN